MDWYLNREFRRKLTSLCQEYLQWDLPPRTAVRDWVLSLHMQSQLQYDCDPNQVIRARILYLVPAKLYPRITSHEVEDTPINVTKFWEEYLQAGERMLAFYQKNKGAVPHAQPKFVIPDELWAEKPTTRAEMLALQTKWKPFWQEAAQPLIDFILEEFLQYTAKTSAAHFASRRRQTVRVPPVLLAKLNRMYRGPKAERWQHVKNAYSRFAGLCIGNHSLAVPYPVWNRMVQELKVEVEGFSNAVNSHEGPFCSPFPEVERPFGAVGNFFEMKFRRGVVAANPPYVNEIMSRAATHILSCCEVSSEPLAFFCTFPYWHDAPAFLQLKEHKYCRAVEPLKAVKFQRFDVEPPEYKTVNSYGLWIANDPYMTQHPDCVNLYQSIVNTWRDMSTADATPVLKSCISLSTTGKTCHIKRKR